MKQNRGVNVTAHAVELPLSTYRLQLNAGFGFDAAVEILPYLRALGISHAYVSPIFKSGRESAHGYDVCSFGEIDAKLGGPAGFERFMRVLDENGLELILDFVPNHMGACIDNDWWRDVLEKGPNSKFATFFDIDWEGDLRRVSAVARVILPILESPYSEVLEAGKLKLIFEQGGFWITYRERRFPASPKTYCVILAELLAIRSQAAWAKAGARVLRRKANFGHIKAFFKEHAGREPLASALGRYLARLNGSHGEVKSFDRLDQILQIQNFRLCWWQIASEEINYRRFFDVNELVCLNMQLPEVFKASHKLLRQIIRRNPSIGVRVDHPDGLWDPEAYFEQLRELWRDVSESPPFIVAEKILTRDEILPASWPVAGTTGYDFLNQVNGIFIDSDNEDQFSEIYRSFTGLELNFHQTLFASRKKVLRESFAASLRTLMKLLLDISARSRYGIDLTSGGLQCSLSDFLAAFPIYRSYAAETSPCPTAQDRKAIEEAIEFAEKSSGHRAPLKFIEHLMLGEYPHDFDKEARGRAIRFCMKAQQLTAPLAAKGREDTACYVYNRLVSLNEVGGDPGQFGIAVSRFHELNQERLENWRSSMTATSTHDTKRSEDVRARINVLSEIPTEWEAAVKRWRQANERFKAGAATPSANDEWLLYQTLAGTWPSEAKPEMKQFVDRIACYMQKAAREARGNTTWTCPNLKYEKELRDFIKKILEQSSENAFLPDFEKFQQRVSFFGYLNSLSQTLLKIASPGAPDFYQGTEVWDFSLVDPDNRRPVDYEKRKTLLTGLQTRHMQGPRAQLARELWDSRSCDGRAKLYVAWQALQARRAGGEVFVQGDYIPVAASGERERHACAFARRHGSNELLVIVPRLVWTLMRGAERLPAGREIWGNTLLTWPGAQEGKMFRERFTDAVIAVGNYEGTIGLRVGEALEGFPVALLESI